MSPSPGRLSVEAAVNARVEFWTLIINRLGLPVVLLGALGYFFWTVYQDIGKPVATTHIRTLDTLAESSKLSAESVRESAASIRSLAETQREQVTEQKSHKLLLERIAETQDEMLKATKAGARDAHTDARDASQKLEKGGTDECVEKPQAGPPGTE